MIFRLFGFCVNEWFAMSESNGSTGYYPYYVVEVKVKVGVVRRMNKEQMRISESEARSP